MNSRFRIFHFSILAALAFSMAMQIGHGVEHLLEELKISECLHQKTDSRHELTHEHHKEHQCPVCHFNHVSFLLTESYPSFTDAEFYTVNSGYGWNREIVSFFSGSLRLHRGPPFIG